jgi:fructose-bisphosphate aldolase, class I
VYQDNGLVPIVEPEILLDGEHGIDHTFEVAQKVWAEVFFYLAENNVMFEGILLKPSMVTPGAECKDKATPEQVADYTLKLLKRRIPPSVPGIMASFSFLNNIYCEYNLYKITFLSGKYIQCLIAT